MQSLRSAAGILIGLAMATLVHAEIADWGIVEDPQGDCPIEENQGKLDFHVPPGIHNLNPVIGDTSAPRVWQEVVGDFVIEAHVLDFPIPAENIGNIRTSYVAAGLVVWQDDKNFLRWTRSAVGESKATFGSAELYEQGKLAAAFNVAWNGQPMWLRLERRAERVFLWISDDGIKWRRHTSLRMPFLPKVKVGVFALNSTKREFAATFSDFYLLESGGK
ncbi:DUF1349 domain-containing protein [Blastopirellula sp. JC732]|uniref:DUF1349 domain-containing protein n=1 Tax=Blastopirellula sediminis TaxID=2894196 RepID=A0A9X1SJN9_9BACT|nr:DUF1349 domain-containing protein [Blastopirellula sediminis]MCC9609765.1 DUF1349 domain-containing protein [Blastopirellula sediminis]MCC9629009.1 DUF1349 domain-containing protein [Blastopirellula sediminis]